MNYKTEIKDSSLRILQGPKLITFDYHITQIFKENKKEDSAGDPLYCSPPPSTSCLNNIGCLALPLDAMMQ